MPHSILWSLLVFSRWDHFLCYWELWTQTGPPSTSWYEIYIIYPYLYSSSEQSFLLYRAHTFSCALAPICSWYHHQSPIANIPFPSAYSTSLYKLDPYQHHSAAAAAAAKSLQSCPTLCNPIDGSPPGSPIPWILQARTLEWVAISFSKAWKWKVKVKLLSPVWLLATPWTAAYQVPPSMGFSRQEY